VTCFIANGPIQWRIQGRGPGDPAPLILGKKEEMTEGKKASRTIKSLENVPEMLKLCPKYHQKIF